MLLRRYEMPWRRAFEAYAGLAWLIAALYFAALPLAGSAPPVAAVSLAAACSVMALQRLVDCNA